MKKTAWIFALALLVAAPAFADFPDDFKKQNTTAAPMKVDIAPLELQQRFDYTGGPGGSPVYVGFAASGKATSASNWLVWKFTYSGSDPIAKQVAYGSWDNRASLTYA